MNSKLYLDTARMGRMSAGAQWAATDFLRLAGNEGGSSDFEEFLRHGSLAKKWRQCYRGLTGWLGIPHLKRDLKLLAGARFTSRLLFSNRTTQLMRLAARLFFGHCRHVLTTDLSWPNYADILSEQADRTGNRLTSVSLRNAVLRERITCSGLIEKLADTFDREQCDGLFLPAVDNLGIRLPVNELVREIRRRAELRFVVIDGAQTFGHVPIHLADDVCDFFIAGCHKWLRAYHPMGLGFYGNPDSQNDIQTRLERWRDQGELDDPLLNFSQELEHGLCLPFGETVNLVSLFSCRGAVNDMLSTGGNDPGYFSQRLANAETIAELFQDAGWRILRPQPEFRSGIVLLETEDRIVRSMSADRLRQRLMSLGVVATTYPEGLVRLSMPKAPWADGQSEILAKAFEAVNSQSTKSFVGV